jgi:chorismate synthase
MLRFLTAGESHGPELVTVVEGFPADVPVEQDSLDLQLARRQGGYGRGARSTRIERDRAMVVGGVAGGRTTGAPVAVRIENRDFANQPANPPPLTAPRPGHADLAGGLKYGHSDFRLVRERASARETAARVVAGTLARCLLAPFGIRVGCFVLAVGEVDLAGVELAQLNDQDLWRLADAAESDPMRCPDPEVSARMRAAVDEARVAGETLGGRVCVFATGAPPGLGSYVHWDRRLDGRLAQAICSIPAIKGVEVGPAAEVARLAGTQAQDPVLALGPAPARGANHGGGLEGGVTTGQPVILRAAMKPLSSVRAPVRTVDTATGEASDAPYVRSDVCAVPAAGVVAEAAMAWVLADALVERFGQDRLDLMLAAWGESGARITAKPAPAEAQEP